MSHWENVPFDILASQLPYLDLENPKTIDALCGDPTIRRRLECENPNGFLWKYLYTHKLSRTLPISLNPTLEERYLEMISFVKPDDLLNMAAEKGYEILVSDLLRKNTYKQKVLNAAFISAIRRDYVNIIDDLIRYGANVHANVDYAVRLASKYGQLDIVKYLVEHGADIHSMADEAIRSAAINGHLDIVKYLISQGANMFNNGHFHITLSLVIRNDHLNVLKYLISIGPTISTQNMDSMLKFASRNGRQDIVDYLTTSLS